MARNGNAYAVKQYNVNRADATDFVANVDTYMAPFISDVDRFAEDIMREVDTIAALREGDSVSHAQNCLVFAICSPQCKFAVNVRASQRMLGRLHEHYATVNDVYKVLTDDGTDSWVTSGNAARCLFASLDFLRHVTDEDMTKATLRTVRKLGKVKGLGEKTMSMALALYDATLNVYTLDVHMLRGIMRAMSKDEAGTMLAQDVAYRMIEDALCAWHLRTFAGWPIFVSQWALWNAWRDGSHESHLGIFGLGV
jgi:3-methyladenine DNA glycosylase/8-oxoguanine DNA glycosylase